MDTVSRSSAWTGIRSITVGLIVLGGTVGAILAVAIYWSLAVMTAGMIVPPRNFWIGASILAMIGTCLGAITTPILAWSFLRHLPLGFWIPRAAIGTYLGAMLAIGASILLGMGEAAILAAMLGGPVGFVITAVWLRIARHPERIAEHAA